MRKSSINRRWESLIAVFMLFPATLTPVFASSISITVKTDKPSYRGTEQVCISGLLTYDYWPVPNELISILVRDAQNLTILIVTRQTDSEGEYNYTFRLPEPSIPGTYTVYVVAVYFDLIATDQAFFEVTSVGTVYIRADGSIEPTTAPIQTSDNITYTLVGDIHDSIEVEKSCVTIDGADHILQGSGVQYSKGFHLAGHNITVKNTSIRGFWWGIEFTYTGGHLITQNSITDNMIGINSHILTGDSIISRNYIANKNTGIRLYQSNRNTISQNKIVNNEIGITIMFESSTNTVTQNIIAGNIVGISLSGGLARQNSIYHNRFLWNTYQATSYVPENNWDDGYPSGGNYWRDYSGTDLYRGPHQNETGSDGIGDTPYGINEDAADRYPLMNPLDVQHDIGIVDVAFSRTVVWGGFAVDVNVTIGNYGSNAEILNVTICVNATAVCTFTDVTITGRDLQTLSFTWETSSYGIGVYGISVEAGPILGETEVADDKFEGGPIIITIPYDTNGDGKINLKDVFQVAKAYGSYPGRPNWDPNCDTNDDLRIDLKDYYMICKYYGTTYT